jgi:predicted amidohydrolase YtcJ
MSLVGRVRVAVPLLVALAGPLAGQEVADILLLRGRVWTGQDNPGFAEALAVRGGRILAVGTTAEVETFRGPRTEVIHLGGRLVLPGFEDAHVHLINGSIRLGRVDFADLKEKPVVDRVKLKVPEPEPAERYQRLLRGMRLLNSFGITSVQDAGLLSPSGDVDADLAMLERARREGRLGVRVSAAVQMEPGKVPATIAQAKRLAARYGDGWLKVAGVKLFVDGVIESKTAALLEPYAGETSLGVSNWTAEALNEAVTAADREGLQTWLHAIGDKGVRMALDAHEAALRANGRLDRRGRIEHLETLQASDYARFKPLGVIASMQPLHANPDQNLLSAWAGALGPERASRAFGWSTFEKAGARLVFGSDWPVVSPSVMHGLFCAATRKTRDGTPPAGWLPQQAVSIESALRHYTTDAAYAAFAEAERGSLEPGKRADLVVLSDDILKGPPETLLKTKVLLTLVDGKPVYRDPVF